MGLFTNTEKKIADAIVNSFNKVETEAQQIEKVLTTDVKTVFDSARTEALAANALVNKLKADLQDALVKAAQLHQTAVDAAIAAQQAAEADAARFKALAAAHAADLATQSAQIVTPPAAPAPVDTPVTAADLSGDGVTATVDPAPAQ